MPREVRVKKELKNELDEIKSVVFEHRDIITLDGGEQFIFTVCIPRCVNTEPKKLLLGYPDVSKKHFDYLSFFDSMLATVQKVERNGSVVFER